ncbi:MAG: Xaa-Pro peptidase family protein [Clostridia bacterium]|nr:Xaa-Pro peptidase family protein [Clostridia bacterium]
MERLDKFSHGLNESGLRAALIQKPENMLYISGYTGEGSILVVDGEGKIITDFRYIEQAQRQCSFMNVERIDSATHREDVIKKYISKKGIDKLAFESDSTTFDEYDKLSEALDGVELVKLPDILSRLRRIKSEDEIEKIVKASEIACKAFMALLDQIRPGMTENDLRLKLEWNMLELGSQDIAFKTIACAGVNGSLPHATPGVHKIAPGELLTFDFGAQVDGYKTDITRTVAIGRISEQLRDIYDTTLEAQLLALDMIAPGVSGFEVDKAVREFIDKKYPGAFGHSLGHGVGLEIHETPTLSQRAKDNLAAGHVVTVEPGIYIPGVGGCRIEDTVILTETGFINPISIPKDLITL